MSILVKSKARGAECWEQGGAVNHPHEYYHADVIKRAGQNILLLTDHFSSLQNVMLIKYESAKDLKRNLSLQDELFRKSQLDKRKEQNEQI